MNEKGVVILTGAAIGLLAVVLVVFGNPGNMGFCIACFLRDIAGSLGLHRAETVQYLRPEILGLVLGAFGSALVNKEFYPVGGSGAFTRFILGFLIMLGMLVFLGCPLRMLLRLGGGDLNALPALLGLGGGVVVGAEFLKRGFTLGRAQPQGKINGYVFPILTVALVLFLFLRPAFIFASIKGPGSLHAPVLISLGAGVFVGILAQRSRFCTVGGLRDWYLFRLPHLFYGFWAVLAVAFLGNLLTRNFHLGFTNQPVAHTDELWNFLGMALAGLGAVFLGGCPLRQLVLAGEGNTDAAVALVGMLLGAATAHNFGFAASPQGVPLGGKVAVLFGFLVIFCLGYFNREGEGA